MEIRNASPADKEKISKLHIASIKRLCRSCYTHVQIEEWTSMLTPSAYDQALKEKIFLVASDSREALLGLGILDVEQAEISAIYVHPDEVGNKIGSKLLENLESIARNCKVKMIHVNSTLNAKNFYLSHGYHEKGPAIHRLPSGLRLGCIRLAKDLVFNQVFSDQMKNPCPATKTIMGEKIKVELAQPSDFDSWLNLAREVEPLFGPMANEKNFQEGLRQAIKGQLALCARSTRDGKSSLLKGGIVISTEANEILWLAVSRDSRKKGIGKQLLTQAISRLDKKKKIFVQTFDKSVPEGKAARKLYLDLGFTDDKSGGLNPAGIPTVIMERNKDL